MPRQSLACDCARISSPDEAFMISSAVFQGKVLKKETKKTSLFHTSSDDPVIITFAVQKVWKGVNTKTITVQTALSEASCGYEFRENQDYFVYANKVDGKLHVNLCSRTNELSKASEDLKYLGTPIKVEKNLKKETEDKPILSVQIWISIGIVFVFIIFFVIIKGLKKNRK